MSQLSHIEHAFSNHLEDQTNYPASVLLAITNEPKPRLLLCRRAMALKSHAGEVSLPGGKREQQDTNNASVALRETHEETGISPNGVTLVGELPTHKARSGLLVKPIIGLVAPNVTLVPEKNEVDRLFWVALADFIPENIKPYRITFKGVKLNTPSFQLQNEVIWGLTGRIIIDFMNKINNQNTPWPMVMTCLNTQYNHEA